MSDEKPKPFAEVDTVGIHLAGERVCADDVTCKRSSDGRQRVAAAINAAVSRRERAAAAKALRDFLGEIKAAETRIKSIHEAELAEGDESGVALAVSRLHALRFVALMAEDRAAAVERG